LDDLAPRLKVYVNTAQKPLNKQEPCEELRREVRELRKTVEQLQKKVKELESERKR
jgi:polyhydroxyalkanoate synthesis regulator phasin